MGQTLRYLSQLSELSVKELNLLKQNLFEYRSELRVLGIDSQPLKMIRLFLDALVTGSRVLMTLCYLLYDTYALLDLAVNLFKDKFASLLRLKPLDRIQAYTKETSYFCDDRVRFIEIKVVKESREGLRDVLLESRFADSRIILAVYLSEYFLARLCTHFFEAVVDRLARGEGSEIHQ